MQVGGAHAYDTPLLLDGFNVTDPATGISSLNLPLEAVSSMNVVRDPMAVTYGGLLGGLVAMESAPGGDHFKAGVQGFVPRPRFGNPGFGRLEGVFPRAYVSGRVSNGPRYMVAAEYDYERFPVPQVTSGQGPDIVAQSGIVFGRLDVDAGDRHHLTFEGLAFPGATDSLGLSPRRADSATVDVSQRDLFGGVTDRFVVDARNVVTIQVDGLHHEMTTQPKGIGTSVLTPAGWSENWFSYGQHTSGRAGLSTTWERVATIHGRSHDFTIGGAVSARRLRGRVANTAIAVKGVARRLVRSVEFGAPSSISASDRPMALSLRDVWDMSDRLQVDAGARVDHSRYGGAAPSARAGVKFALSESGTTALKVGYGAFVGNLPLAVPAFGGYPIRVDRFIDPTTGDTLSEVTLQPTVGSLMAPRSVAATVAIERQLLPGLDAQVSLTDRHSTRVPTFDVPAVSGPLVVASTGTGSYREAQVSVRRKWEHDQQLFISYVRSASVGELNDFSALYASIDVPLAQRGGQSRLPGDAPNRLLAWATVDLPRRFVISPVMEWRSGFPYSVVDERYTYLGPPNSRRYPTFFSTDLVIYKTLTVHQKSADLGIQLFNVTDHYNPRDVYPVAGSPSFGAFTNSVGPILRGYMLLKW